MLLDSGLLFNSEIVAVGCSDFYQFGLQVSSTCFCKTDKFTDISDHSLIFMTTCNLDYYRILVATFENASDTLVQSVAAFLVAGSNLHAYSPHFLKHFHCLQVCFQVQFKILFLIFKVLNNVGPDYFRELLLCKNHSPCN